MVVSSTEWLITGVVTIAVLLFDVVAIARHPHEPSNKESSIALSVYAALPWPSAGGSGSSTVRRTASSSTPDG
ncbi:MAG: hypothetical protein WKF83_04410 [Nocardioidaceae bacterium]